MTVVLTIGTFDLLHRGHLELLRACRAVGSVVVAVNTDDFILRFKGHPPVQPLPDRMEALRECRLVDAVLVNTGAELAGPVIEVACPDVLMVGDDWQGRDYVGAQLRLPEGFLEDRGIRLAYVPRTTGESTTSIRARIAGG